MTPLPPDKRQQLIAAAIGARDHAYAPYSQFRVGAALLVEPGEIITGCNVENAAYGLSMCAERVAMCTAISRGQKNILGMAIAASPLATPCGACRQFLAEFDTQFEVISIDSNTREQRSWMLAELLPEAFQLKRQ